MSESHPLIFVVDDEDAVRTALRRLLQSAEFAVDSFGSGEDFLVALNTRKPDCAILDLQMPGMSGFDVLERLAETHANVPVIIMTGNDSPEARETALNGGAAAYLRKPIGDRVLLDAISKAIPYPSPDKAPNA
jgi:FixJ family two-component response regulator